MEEEKHLMDETNENMEKDKILIMETLFHGTNVILIAMVNYYKKKDEGGC